MRRPSLENMSVAELVHYFAEVTLAQDEADLGGQISKYNRLFDKMMEISNELKRREGDQRAQLMSLYAHANVHVRLQAAKMTLAVAPSEARDQLRAIVDLEWFPQSGDAGMCLRLLERGVYKPK